MTIQVKVSMMDGCSELLPKKEHHDDAAFDMRSRENVIIQPKKPKLVGTGIFLELPSGYEAQVRPRSGLAAKHSLTVLNTPGTVDAGYRGEVKVIIFNAGEEDYEIHIGDRIAQMVINKLPDVELVLSEKLTKTTRGSGGFGSTGKQ